MRERTVSTARTPHTEWLANESLWCEGMHNTKHWRMNMVRFGMALHTTIVCEGLATWNIWQLQWPILPLLCRSSENGHGGGCCHLPHATYTHMTHDRIIHYFYDKIRVCAITSFVVWINAFVWHSHHTHTQHNIHARCAVNPKTQSYEWIKFILCVLCVWCHVYISMSDNCAKVIYGIKYDRVANDRGLGRSLANAFRTTVHMTRGACVVRQPNAPKTVFSKRGRRKILLPQNGMILHNWHTGTGT